ncbi:MAG: DUF4288 domain-containing protein [Bacteroidota bacterium]
MWYIAELVQEITVDGEPNNVVHINSVLIQAENDEEAYTAALAEAYEDEYENPRGQTVRHRFVGLRELVRVYEELEHGAELAYEERIGVSLDDLSELATARHDLAVFRPPEPPTGPDYASRVILDEAVRLVRRHRAGGDGL